MQEITIILFASVIIPFVFRNREDNKSWYVALGLLFFVWAFQFEMTCDWPVYVGRWQQATQGIMWQDRELEVVYAFIMKLCSPLTYFGYLMLCAAFSIGVFCLYISKYIPKDLSWLFFLTFSLNVSLSLEFIDTNRQTLAIMFVLIAVYLMANKAELYWKDKYVVVAALLVIAAFNIHKSAIIAAPILLFPFVIPNITNSKYLYAFLALDIFSFFVDYSAIASTFDAYMSGEEALADYSHYVEEIAERSKSFIEQGIYMGLIYLLVRFYDDFEDNEKPIVLAALVFLSLQGYAMYTMLRVLSYYKIFVAFSIPILYNKVRQYFDEGLSPTIAYAVLAFYAAYQVFRYSVDIYGPNYEGYEHFQTIFSAPTWM